MPDNLKEFKDTLDNMMVNLCNMSIDDFMRQYEGFNRTFSGKFTNFSVAFNMELDAPSIHITPNKNNISNYKELHRRKKQIEEELEKIENPNVYKMKQESKHMKEYPWKAGYVCSMKEGTENPVVSSYTAKRKEFDMWYQQTLSIANDTIMIGFTNGQHDEKEFKDHKAAEKWLTEEVKQYEI